MPHFVGFALYFKEIAFRYLGSVFFSYFYKLTAHRALNQHYIFRPTAGRAEFLLCCVVDDSNESELKDDAEYPAVFKDSPEVEFDGAV
jgi:hypothetical protein